MAEYHNSCYQMSTVSVKIKLLVDEAKEDRGWSEGPVGKAGVITIGSAGRQGRHLYKDRFI
jgi:hypothetical protein